MEQQEIMMAYYELYEKMSQSKEIKAARIFGDTMKSMLEDLVTLKPELAEEYIERLSAIKWNNYLTKKEALRITERMSPSANWSLDAWEQAMIDIPVEDNPYYNQYALFVVMNQVVSDHGKSIALIRGVETVNDIDSSELIKFAYRLAIDLLKDEDGVYNVRRYFNGE